VLIAQAVFLLQHADILTDRQTSGCTDYLLHTMAFAIRGNQYRKTQITNANTAVMVAASIMDHLFANYFVQHHYFKYAENNY